MNRSVQQLDLNLLKVFEVLFQEQNMTRTAEALFLSPSAVSHAIKRLREALGDPLFERQGNQMKPTSACLRIAPIIFEQLVSLRKSLQQFSVFDPQSAEQTFTIAVHDALESLFIPTLLAKIKSTSAKLGLSCIQLDRPNLTRQLATGIADVAIDVAMPLKRPIQHQKLSEDKFVVMMGINQTQNHQTQKNELSKAAYLEREHLTVSNRPSGRVVEDIDLQRQSINRHVAMRCQSYHTAKAILKQTDLLLTLPSSIALMLKDQDLEILPLPITVPSIETHLYWHENTMQDSAINWLKEQIVTVSQSQLN